MNTNLFQRVRFHIFDGDDEVFSVPARMFEHVSPALYSMRWTIEGKVKWSYWMTRAQCVREISKVWGSGAGIVVTIDGMIQEADA